jgi:hypothetical protein
MKKDRWNPHAVDVAQDARDVLRSLLVGRDPMRGKPLPKGTCLSAARVWRALFVALVQLGEGSHASARTPTRREANASTRFRGGTARRTGRLATATHFSTRLATPSRLVE